jgi:hypothetical protein
MSSDVEHPPNNGAVLTIAQIIKAVMSSAAEAKVGALYINVREAVPMRITLEEMGHPQPRTPMQTDNLCALGVATLNVHPKRLKAMDMRFHWLRDRDAQGQFRFYWRPGPTNLGDYHSKHHPGPHHTDQRYNYLTPPRYVELLRRAKQLAGAVVNIGRAILASSPASHVC